MKALEHHLRQLRLPHLAAALPRALEQAGSEGWSHEQFLSTLLEQEAFGREQSGIGMRLKHARFPAIKTLEDFNKGVHPGSLPKYANSKRRRVARIRAGV